ncbi:hypothetical protein BJY52DRAFT_1195848 [Lactarius psammicola]|nr:hypothetical protein BJY52DRAFT_1195848 [Lactarius psammicola]
MVLVHYRLLRRLSDPTGLDALLRFVECCSRILFLWVETGYANFYLAAPLQLHKDNDYPCSNEGFNLSVAVVINALDSGVEDSQGDLEQAGLIPSSWFHLATAMLGAILRGALRSGGRKIQGRVKIDDADGDIWNLADGLTPPVTQGGRIATQAQQITNFFMHYAGADEPPLVDFYESVLRVGQAHIEKVVRLKAAATYQISANDAKGLADMVYDDMVRQTYEHMVRDEDARRKANQKSLDRLFVEAQTQLGPFINEWKSLYKHFLVEALKDDLEAHSEPPPVSDPLLDENFGARELRESIADTVTDPILDGDEITRARERIRLDHAEEIEAVRHETRAQISSEKKAWAVAYRDLVKLDWLSKAAEELGYTLVSKDDTEEREGWTAKCHAGPVGKRDRSSSRASNATPSKVPATPENQPRLLDTLRTPTARKKTKGKHALAQPRPLRSRSISLSSQPSDLSDAPDVDMSDIKPPLFFPSSYPAVTSISIPADVRPSQAPDADLRDPRSHLSEPATDISVFVAPAPAAPITPAPDTASPSRVPTPDSTRGVALSMHNPDNVMADDLPSAKTPEAVVVPPALPSLQPIPLLPGLAEMLNALQANLMTSFTSQINTLSSRIDAQDELIKIRVQPKKTGKDRVVAQGPPASSPAAAPPPTTLGTPPSGPPLPSKTPPSEALPVPDPTPIPRPPPIPPRSTRPPRAILPEKTTWAGIVTPANFGQNHTARDSSHGNANIIGRTAGGASRKGKPNPPVSIDNTEITIARGEGLLDKAAEDRLYKSNPGSIMQAARSAMEHAIFAADRTKGRITASTARPRPTLWLDSAIAATPCLLCGGRHNARSPNCPVRGGFKPSPLADPSSSQPANKTPSQTAPQNAADAEGFTTIGKNGKDAVPPAKLSRTAKRNQARRAKKAAAIPPSEGLPTAGPSNPNLNGDNQGSSVMNVIFPDDVATITETIDAFRKLAYATCDGSKEDLQRAMMELERGWGVPTEHLDNLFSLPARYAVKHVLPLTIPQVEDSVAQGEGGLERVAERVHAFRAAWGSTQPIHFVYHSLPAATQFATEEEVEARRK